MKAFLLMLIFICSSALAQEKAMTIAQVQVAIDGTLASRWYDKIHLKGYAHFRYNRLLETNNKLTSPSGDRSIGDRKGLFLRRARLTFYGEVSERIYIYIQPDYSQDVAFNGSAQQNFLNIRDAYFDYALTDDKDLRLRTGVTKVPFGFETLQSSANRPALDRSDAINSAAPNERDTGIFLIYTPKYLRRRFEKLSALTYKGSGDYGIINVGVYNGQTLNRSEENNDLHRVIRVTHPYQLDNGQILEASLQAYEGKYRVNSGQDIYDQRSAVSLIYYPQPLGLQMEYTIGQGPEFDKSINLVRKANLSGGYAQVSYSAEFDNYRFFPYVRFQEYDGGRKLDNGNHLITREWELGSEWQPDPALELTVAYQISDRIIESANLDQNSNEKGQLLRLQAQFNY